MDVSEAVDERLGLRGVDRTTVCDAPGRGLRDWSVGGSSLKPFGRRTSAFDWIVEP